MFILYMTSEVQSSDPTHGAIRCTRVKDILGDATDEAEGRHELLLLGGFFSQLSEGVDDDTKDDVEEQHDDHHKEAHIIGDASSQFTKGSEAEKGREREGEREFEKEEET
jgi:hypothetical protein